MKNNKRKSFYSLLLVFAMVLQIVAPAFANTVIAEEEIKAESEEILDREDGDTSEDGKEGEVNQLPETVNNDQTSEEVEEKSKEEKTETEDQNKNEQEENSSTSDPQENESKDEVADENETETNGDKGGFHLVLDKATQGPNDEPFNEANPLNPTDEFFMHYKWSLDEGHGYDAGDTVSFDLPKQLNILANADGELADESGTVFANYHVSTDGTVTFTFTEAVDNLSAIEGDFFIKSKLNPSETEIEDGKVTIGPMDEGGHLDIPVNTSDMAANISKAGTPLPAFSPKEIEWTITVDSKMLKHKDGKVTDMLPPGLTYKPESIIINGEAAEEPTIDGQKLEITLGEFSGTKTITFITTIDDEHWDNKSFYNKASYEATDVDKIEAGASVTIDRGEPLSKKGGHYNPVTQEMEWEIELNFNGKTVTDTSLQDSWTEGLMELVDGSLEFYEVSIDDNGIANIGQKADVGHTSVKNDSSGFEVSIPNIDKPYIVKYKTKLNDRLIEGQNISNSVKWDGNTSKGTVWAEQGVGYKGHSNVNYKDKTVDWYLLANTDEKDMTKFTINDTFGSGLTLKEDTFVVTVGGKTLTKGTDYTFTATDNGFTIQFIGAYETLKEAVEVKYTTDFDYTKLKPGENFTNHAKYTWYTEGKDTPWEKEVNDGFTPDDFTKNDGNKSGYYDARDKTITWTIAVNYQQNAHEELIVKDLIQGNQKLLPDTIKVSEGVLGGGNNSIWAGNEIADANVTKPEVDGKPGFKVNLGKTDKPYVITYKTSLEGLGYIEKNYKNTANVFDGSTPLTDLPADVGITQGGKYGGKTGKQNSKAIDWTVTVNESQAKVENVLLTDTLSDNQEFLKDTIKVYATTVDNFGNITKGAAYDKVTINVTEEAPQILTVKFNDEIDRPYIIEYSTLYFAGHDEIVSNDYKVTGSNIGDKGEQGGTESVTIDQSTGGSGSGKVGYLQVKKIASDDNNKVFEGIEFQLIDEKTSKVLKTGVTDKDGNIDFGRLMYGKYLLKETKAPEGYITPSEAYKLTINEEYVKGDTQKIGNIETIINDKEIRYAEIKKVNLDGEPLQGAEFIIKNDNNEVVELGLVTDEKGIVTTKELPDGQYTLIETKAPIGYKLLKEEIEFTIESGKTEPITIEVKNELAPTKDIQISKKWDEVDSSYRPEELEFTISANDEVLDVNPELISDEGNEWKYIYKDLPIYDREGKLIVYLIEEVEHKGYDVSYLEKGGKIGLEEIEIINKQKVKEIQITKVWDEVDPSYRPEELEFTISANDEVLDVNPALVSDEGNEWKYIYKDLPIYDSKGELIVYLIEEVEHRGYDVSYLEKGGKIGLEEIEITNKQKTTSLSVEKTWDEVDSFYRPEQIAINLLANGKHYKTVTMKYSNSLDKWTHTFENLPKYDRDGKLIKYTIEEAEVMEGSLKGYEVSEVVYENQDTEEDKTIIAKLTNTQEKTSISGKKVWKDDNSTERPESIKVDVMHGSRLVKTVDIKVDNHRDNEWKFTISNLAKYDSEGKEIVYTIKEHEVEGYESAIEDFDITNTRVGKRDILVSKSWKDDNSTSRPSLIKVDLLANGEIKETVEISSKDNWEYTFTDLDKYDLEGKKIVYTIKEHAVEGYESVIEDFDITNTRVGKRDIVVSKSWKDDNSTSRPSLIKVDLLANGEIKETVEISSKDKWEYTFTDLDKYDSEGKEIVYTIKEHEVEGYETIIDGFKITNKLKPTDPNGGINPGEHNPGKDPNGGIKPGEHNPGGSPTTGDSGIWMYLSLLVVASVSVVFLRKRQAIK